MKIKYAIAVVVIALLVYLGLNTQGSREEVNDAAMHRSYTNDKDLYGIDALTDLEQQHDEYIYGGIVSHHLLANLDMAKFFFEFADQDVERVILVGPNHFYPNIHTAISTMQSYETPYGEVETDVRFVQELADERLVQLEPAIMETEHAISSLVPYVARYLSKAELVPIILDRSVDASRLEELTEQLISQSNKKTIVVASVDFSHHLYSNASNAHDLRSLAAILSFDYDALWTAELDSPQSLYILLNYLETVEAQQFSYWQQDASRIFADHDIEDVTSYVFAHALPGEAEPRDGTSILFFGDTMLGRETGRQIEEGKDFFAGIRGPEGLFLRGNDAIFANLESAILSRWCTTQDELAIPRERLSVLSGNGITHLGTSNNHFSRCDVEEGARILLEDGFAVLETMRPTVVEGTGNSVSLISIYAAPVPANTSEILSQVSEIIASSKSDWHVANIHWGVEYSTEPSNAQKELAHDLIDVGIDLIIGHHPHVVQPVEVYKDGLIAYSLGNFIFDQVGTATQSGLSAIAFFGNANLELFLFPFIQESFVPTHITQAEARDVCAEIIRGYEFENDAHPCVISAD